MSVANTTGGAMQQRPAQNVSTAGSALRVARQEQTHGGARPDHRAARTTPARIQLLLYCLSQVLWRYGCSRVKLAPLVIFLQFV
jgi:hypothetical protein